MGHFNRYNYPDDYSPAPRLLIVLEVILRIIYSCKRELVRCRYLSAAGFLSQTSDFPHTFPLPGPEKVKWRQQSLSQKERGQSGALRGVNCGLLAGRELES